MALYKIFAIAFALAVDAFSVAASIGGVLKKVSKRQNFRLSFHFGFFQFLMPIIGWLGGKQFAKIAGTAGYIIAFSFLMFIGFKMVLSSFQKSSSNKRLSDPTRKWNLIILSLSVSIDALAVGFSFALMGISVLYPAFIIGVVASAMTFLGIFIGTLLGRWLGKGMEIIGGIILILIGIHVILTSSF